jgi:RimJ/RimL family protein N-acetyltransferase
VPRLDAGEGLVLDALTEADAAGVLALASDAVAQQWSPSFRSVRSVEDARGWVERRNTNPAGMTWAVREASTGELVGRVNISRIDDWSGSGEIGYSVRADRRGRGIAAAAARAVTAYAFADLGLKRLALVHALGNVASCGVARAAAYAYEGTLRQYLDHGDGVRHDAHLHGRVPGDSGAPIPAGEVPVPIEPVELVVGRLVLRPPGPEHVADVLAMGEDPEIEQWNAVKAKDEAGALAWVAKAANWSDGEHATFAILDATSGRFLGNTSIFRVDRGMSDGEAGYRIAPWARRQGVATQAVRAVAAWAFEALDLERICLYHGLENVGSCRVAEQAGYAYEGTLRSSYRYGDGIRHDEHLHGRLRSDPVPE